MKESKLMKEVVKRSVQPDLDMISTRILEEHENKIETRMASVRSHYLSAAVACVGLVFIVGLVMGLIIMRGAMKRDLDPNTAPEIIPPNGSVTDSSDPVSDPSSSEDLPDSGVDDGQPAELLYIEYNGNKYYTYVSGEAATRRNVKRIQIDSQRLRFLSDQNFIGLVDNNDTGTPLTPRSNYFENGAVVFKSRNNDTFYVYTKTGIFKFGYDEPADMNLNFSLEQPSIRIDSGSRITKFRYGGVMFIYSSSNWTPYHYTNQGNFLNTAEVGILDDTVFLGTIVSEEDGEKGVYCESIEKGCAVFYNKEKNMMITIGLEDDSSISVYKFEAPAE